MHAPCRSPHAFFLALSPVRLLPLHVSSTVDRSALTSPRAPDPASPHCCLCLTCPSQDLASAATSLGVTFKPTVKDVDTAAAATAMWLFDSTATVLPGACLDSPWRCHVIVAVFARPLRREKRERPPSPPRPMSVRRLRHGRAVRQQPCRGGGLLPSRPCLRWAFHRPHPRAQRPPGDRVVPRERMARKSTTSRWRPLHRLSLLPWLRYLRAAAVSVRGVGRSLLRQGHNLPRDEPRLKVVSRRGCCCSPACVQGGGGAAGDRRRGGRDRLAEAAQDDEGGDEGAPVQGALVQAGPGVLSALLCIHEQLLLSPAFRRCHSLPSFVCRVRLSLLCV